MFKQKLIILESSDISARYLAEAAKLVDLDPIFFCRLNDYQGDTRSQILSYSHVDIDTSNKNLMLDYICKNNMSVGGVVSLLDSYMSIACDLACELRCPGVDKSVGALKDKLNVVNLVPEFSPKTLEFLRNDKSYEPLRNFLSQNDSGIIVKPRFAAGALGFFSISNEYELDLAFKALKEIALPERLSPSLWIAQRRVPGRVISMEGFVVAGEMVRLGFTATSKVGNTQSKCYFPFDRQIEPHAIDVAEEAVQALVTRSQFKQGYFHTEFIIENDNAVLIDSNFGRLGGGGVGEHLALSAGVDPIQIFSHYLMVTLKGQASIELSHKKMKNLTRAYLYGIETEGTLKGVRSQLHPKCYHTRILDPGTLVPAMGVNNWSWIGILTGLDEDIDSEFSRIEILTHRGWERAVC